MTMPRYALVLTSLALLVGVLVGVPLLRDFPSRGALADLSLRADLLALSAPGDTVADSLNFDTAAGDLAGLGGAALPVVVASRVNAGDFAAGQRRAHALERPEFLKLEFSGRGIRVVLASLVVEPPLTAFSNLLSDAAIAVV